MREIPKLPAPLNPCIVCRVISAKVQSSGAALCRYRRLEVMVLRRYQHIQLVRRFNSVLEIFLSFTGSSERLA